MSVKRRPLVTISTGEKKKSNSVETVQISVSHLTTSNFLILLIQILVVCFCSWEFFLHRWQKMYNLLQVNCRTAFIILIFFNIADDLDWV